MNLRVNALTLRFTTKTGRPLTPAEAASLFSGLAVHQDSNFNGVYDPGVDAQLTSVDSLNLNGGGQLLIELPANQAAVTVGPGGSMRYFVTGTTLSNRCFASDTVQIAHIPNAMTVVNQATGYRMTGEYMRSIDVLGTPQESSQTPVVINEIMADNTHTLEDPNEPQEYPDWIELYNPASVPVNLGGMFLSDDPANSQLYRIPDDVIIAANDYLVFIADGEPEQGPLHTNFRLSKGGESVTLIDKADRSYRLVDQIEYDGLAADATYGRLPNGSSTWKRAGRRYPRQLQSGSAAHYSSPRLCSRHSQRRRLSLGRATRCALPEPHVHGVSIHVKPNPTRIVVVPCPVRVADSGGDNLFDKRSTRSDPRSSGPVRCPAGARAAPCRFRPERHPHQRDHGFE